MKQLKRQEYKKFVEQHILRPYQSMISESDKPLNFTNEFYNSIPRLVEDNKEWADNVFERISNIYGSIDGDYFPKGRAAITIITNLQWHGVICSVD